MCCCSNVGLIRVSLLFFNAKIISKVYFGVSLKHLVSQVLLHGRE
jgi:hypothetical protein